jgi:hypothetical protein
MRVLEDHLHLPVEPPGLLAPGPEGVLAVVDDLPARRFVEPHEDPPGRRLAASGLAHEAERLALLDPE